MATFPEVAAWLARAPKADRAFGAIVEAVEADPDNDGEMFFIRTGSGGRVYAGNVQVPMTGPVLNDLVGKGLVRIGRYTSKGDAVYELPAEAHEFARWRRGLPSPVVQVARQASAIVDDAGFDKRHPEAAAGLRAAFEMLDSDDPLTTAELAIFGEYLKGALVDVAGAQAGLPLPDERLAEVFKPHREAASARGDIATGLLLDYVRSVLHLVHGLRHGRDELTEGRAVADDETLRRAAFLTAVACFELDRIPLAS